jgi:hypothetical protein
MRIDFEKHNPFRRPDWRHERVLNMLGRMPTPGRCTKRDDEWVRGLRKFVLRYQNADPAQRDQIGYENPGLYFAYLIFERTEEDFEPAFMVESRLLARQSFEDIARELDTIPEAVEWYEKLFFNVTDRLHAHDWIMKHVLVPAVERSAGRAQPQNGRAPRKPIAEAFYDASLKCFGYYGGPIAIDFMLSGFSRGMEPQSRDDISPWLDAHTALAAKRRSAMAVGQFDVDKWNVMDLFAFHARLMEIEKSEEHAAKARSEIEKNIDGLMTEIGWTVGRDGGKAFEGTALIEMQAGAVELRDHQLLPAAAGVEVPEIEQLRTITMPSPRQREVADGEDKSEDSQQTA